jgi:hypothetical protein
MDIDDALRSIKVKEMQQLGAGLPESSERFRLIRKGIEQITCDDVADESVNTMVVDMPYERSYVHLHEPLAKLASRVLVQSGSLLLMTGRLYLPEVFRLMEPFLDYHSISWYDTPGPTCQLPGHRVTCTGKPVVWFCKGPYRGKFCQDSFQSDEPDKRYHPWGQSVSGISEIIACHSNPGDTIFDCCVGGGSTAIAALRLDRFFVGSDIDPIAVDITKGRILEYLNEQRAEKESDITLGNSYLSLVA